MKWLFIIVANCFASLYKLATSNHWDLCPFLKADCSSSFKLDGFCWWTAIFKSGHRLSIGLRSGLWLGHSNKCFPLNHWSVALAVCLGSLSCLKGKHPSQSQITGKLNQVLLRNIPVFSTIHLSIDSDQFPSPCCWKTSSQHDAATAMWQFFGDGVLVVIRHVEFVSEIAFSLVAKKF